MILGYVIMRIIKILLIIVGTRIIWVSIFGRDPSNFGQSTLTEYIIGSLYYVTVILLLYLFRDKKK